MAMASSENEAPAGALFAPIVRLVRRSWILVLFFVGFFATWQLSIIVFGVPAYILPKPSDIVVRGWADIDRLVYYTWITGSESVLGYFVAVSIAMPLGLAIAFSPLLRQTIYPFFVSLEMTPKIAFAPLFISWLGFGLLPKVVIVFLVCFFPIVLNAILAFGSLSEGSNASCRRPAPMPGAPSSGAAAAMPQCFVGFKYAAISATVGDVAKFIGSDQGLGYVQIVTGNMRPISP